MNFAGIALKLEKKWPTFFQILIHAHPCHPKQQTIGNNFNAFKWSQRPKLVHYFWNSIAAKTRFRVF